jgi:L-threonylcarbamoyladenylate synthase
MIVPNNKPSRIQAAQIIRRGGVIAYRTDTFYGLGANPFNREAIVRIKDLKGREEAKPILLLISDIDQLERFIGEPPGIFKAIAIGHWPAPLTLIGPSRPELPIELTAATNSIGLRLPDDDNVRELVRACGGALTATSANPSGQPPARSAEEVANYFPNGLDLIVDGGEVNVTEPSTVVDLSGPQPRLIRAGAVKRERLDKILEWPSSHRDARTSKNRSECF